MPTAKNWFVSFRVATEIIKNELNKFFNDMADQNPAFANKGEALYAYMKQGKELFEISRKGLPPQSAQETIDQINCPYLQYDENWFCLELVHRTKKKKELGWNAKETLALCISCKDGKADQIREQYQKKLRGQNIKGILQLITLFQKLAQDGVPSTIYFCNRIAESQIFTGLKTITCTLVNAKVSIDKCKELPCEYFEEYSIIIEQEFPAQTLQLIEGIAEDYKRIEDLSPRKEVESKQVDPDVQGEETETSEG